MERIGSERVLSGEHKHGVTVDIVQEIKGGKTYGMREEKKEVLSQPGYEFVNG